MGVRPAGQGSPKGRPRSGGRGNDFVGPQRSEGEAKWWDPAVLDAPVARPSEWDNREPGSLPSSSELDSCRDLLRDLCQRRLQAIDLR